MDPAWLLLLLPLASASGFWLGRRQQDRDRGHEVDRLSRSYFRGLNLLLNEQTDKALQVFLEIAELDSDTLETQLALGNLFRRRGELDRAIRLHQALSQKPLLSAEQRVQALLELGEDFARAGLLDRAEALYLDVLRLEPRARLALERLLGIYEHERDWPKALEILEQLERQCGHSEPGRAAHYLAEMGEQALADARLEQAQSFAQQAVARAPMSFRPYALSTRIALKRGDGAGAIDMLQAAARLELIFMPELVGLIELAASMPGQAAACVALLQELIPKDQSVAALLSLGRMLRQSDGIELERRLYVERLGAKPSVRVLKELLAADARKAEIEESPLLKLSIDVLSAYLERKPAYQCQRCGFRGKELYWQCPSCKVWDSTRPVPAGAGE